MEIAEGVIVLGKLIVSLALVIAILRGTIPEVTWEWKMFHAGLVITGAAVIAKLALTAFS